MSVLEFNLINKNVGRLVIPHLINAHTTIQWSIIDDVGL